MSVIKKNGRFYLRKYFDGKQQTVPLGDKKGIAEKRASVFIASVEEIGYKSARAKFDGKPIVIPGDNPTAKEIETLYRKLWNGQSGGPRQVTIELNVSRLHLFFKRAKAERLKDLDKTTLSALWHGDKPRTPASETTFASAVGAAASIFTPDALKFYATEGFPIENPFLGVGKDKPTPTPYRPFSADIGEKIFKNCQTELKPHDAMVVILAQMVGMRLGEIEAARPEWFSIQDKETVIVDISPTAAFNPKAGKAGSVPFDRAIYDLLLKLRGETDSAYFVPTKSVKAAGRLDERSKVINIWIKKQGVTNAKPLHGLRKQFGSIIYLQHGLIEAAAMLRNTVAVCSGYYAGIESKPTAKITSSFAPAKTPEEKVAESMGITLEELKARLSKPA